MKGPELSVLPSPMDSQTVQREELMILGADSASGTVLHALCQEQRRERGHMSMLMHMHMQEKMRPGSLCLPSLLF